jgi:hypothetical protein
MPVDLNRRADVDHKRSHSRSLSNHSIATIVHSDKSAYKGRCPARQSPIRFRLELSSRIPRSTRVKHKGDPIGFWTCTDSRCALSPNFGIFVAGVIAKFVMPGDIGLTGVVLYGSAQYYRSVVSDLFSDKDTAGIDPKLLQCCSFTTSLCAVDAQFKCQRHRYSRRMGALPSSASIARFVEIRKVTHHRSGRRTLVLRCPSGD